MKITKRPKWIWRVLIVAGLALLIQVPPVILLFIRHTSTVPIQLTGWMIIYILIFALIIYWSCHTYFKYRRWQPQQQTFIQHLKWIIGGWLLVIGGEQILNLLNYLIYHQTETANNQIIAHLLSSNHVVLIIMSFAAVVLNPIAEELIFRGVVMNFFFNDDAFWLPILLSGILFTLEHSSTTLISYLIYFYLGSVFAFIYRKTGNLTNTIWLHALNNLIALSALLGTMK
ncbi:CPBP family intramembrane glutamic endopeptidase [uncultured Limosilactobacillus sp.]|uniref:CPBP family intramembrane glutamic endopeptidase n=1 Tax=uncultured Limosilactobacillus sp. TaxID=2837629 RepID=UPI0025D8B553|nr:type II CAAX endopeptidase family protein [uncultured Limosilactobacillus sp.]